MNEKPNTLWDIIFNILFLVIVVLMYISLKSLNVQIPTSISTFHIIVLILATTRLIRLICYDKVFESLRTMFDNTNTKSKLLNGFNREMKTLLNCPWCIGVWISMFVIYLYLIDTFFTYLFYILALAGIASILQITANLIGWNAQYKKEQTNQLIKK